MRTRHATHPAAVPLVERVAEGGGGGDLTGEPLGRTDEPGFEHPTTTSASQGAYH